GRQRPSDPQWVLAARVPDGERLLGGPAAARPDVEHRPEWVEPDSGRPAGGYRRVLTRGTSRATVVRVWRVRSVSVRHWPQVAPARGRLGRIDPSGVRKLPIRTTARPC